MKNLTSEELQSIRDLCFNDKFTTYVKVIEGVKKGSIGRITDVRKLGSRYNYANSTYVYEVDNGTEIQLEFDGKRGFAYKAIWCEVLKNYDGPTIYAHDNKNVPITNDMFGNPIELDTVVAFADKSVMCVGVVKRITPAGGVHVKIIKKGMESWQESRMTEEEKESTLHRIPYANIGTYVIKPDALKELMYHKLVGL